MISNYIHHTIINIFKSRTTHKTIHFIVHLSESHISVSSQMFRLFLTLQSINKNMLYTILLKKDKNRTDGITVYFITTFFSFFFYLNNRMCKKQVGHQSAADFTHSSPEILLLKNKKTSQSLFSKSMVGHISCSCFNIMSATSEKALSIITFTLLSDFKF